EPQLHLLGEGRRVGPEVDEGDSGALPRIGEVDAQELVGAALDHVAAAAPDTERGSRARVVVGEIGGSRAALTRHVEARERYRGPPEVARRDRSGERGGHGRRVEDGIRRTG